MLHYLTNVISKVEIFICVRAEIYPAVCFTVPNSFPALAARIDSTVVSKLRTERSDRTKECDHKKKLCVCSIQAQLDVHYIL
jgi:hypothetical protein